MHSITIICVAYKLFMLNTQCIYCTYLCNYTCYLYGQFYLRISYSISRDCLPVSVCFTIFYVTSVFCTYRLQSIIKYQEITLLLNIGVIHIKKIQHYVAPDIFQYISRYLHSFITFN